MKVWQHDFDGSCAPRANGVPKYTAQETFSVGIFQWIPRHNGEGCKRSAVKVRVKGRCNRPDSVYAKAREIADALDAGTYVGPKSVKAS